jgi:hypothetical protein
MEKDVKSVEDFNEKKELLRVKKKYSPKYILTAKLAEVYLIFLLFIAICFASKKIAYGFLGMIALILSVLGFLIISKKNAKSNYISFYDDKVVYKGKKLWWDSERTLKYSEIKDITFTQGSSFFEKRIQKLMNLGNIYVYPKKGNIYTRGMQLEIVDKIDEVVEKIKTVAGDKIR